MMHNKSWATPFRMDGNGCKTLGMTVTQFASASKMQGYGVIEGHKHDIQRSQDFRTHVKEPLWKAVSPTTELIAGYVALHGSEDKDGDLSLWWGSCMGPSDNTTGEKGMKLKDLLNMLLELPSAEDASVYLFLDMCRSKTSTLVAESQAGHVAPFAEAVPAHNHSGICMRFRTASRRWARCPQ